jgi:hypothetical protein
MAALRAIDPIKKGEAGCFEGVLLPPVCLPAVRFLATLRGVRLRVVSLQRREP